MANARIREALAAGNNTKEKGPQVADGVLSVTPDSPESAEWRARGLVDCAGTSSTFLDDDDDGPKPNELYGRFTWKIDHFSEISKRELRSNVFDVGSYKWYILVYPQGCDVCNHLSLFLCVADYDKLLPGWSHFAQFTIAVVNKDPKKSKYSDTLHRFCKKEHDWGWKKFMELSKVLDGFTVADTLVIKAQVQVILDKPNKPFRCLDPQYRRELVRVYLTNVESICRKFCDERRARLAWVREDPKKFKEFWDSLSSDQRKPLIKEKGEIILKGIVKQFFNEKEVTSTLVMDALYSGCRQIEEYTQQWQQGKGGEGAPMVTVNADKNVFGFGCQLLEIIDRASKEFIPLYKDDKVQDSLSLRSGQEGDELRRDSVERDEKRLAELGRKTVEMYVISHVLCERLEIAYREAEALRRQELLIAEEEEAGRREENRIAAKAMADREKRAKKKERKKQKKEADRAKREAEESERARVDEQRRLQLEKRQQEVNRRRAEEEEQQQQSVAPQQQPQLPQQQPQAKVQQAGKKRKQQAAKEAPPTASTSNVGNAVATRGPVAGAHSSGGGGSLVQPSSSSKAAPHALSSSSARSAPADRPSTSSPADDDSSGSSSSSSSSSSGSSSDNTPDDSGSDSEVMPLPGRASGTSSSRQAPPVAAAVPAGPRGGAAAGAVRGVDELKSQVYVLQERVKDLEITLHDRDTEILALRAQLSELNASVELADLVRQARFSAAAKESNGLEAPQSQQQPEKAATPEPSPPQPQAASRAPARPSPAAAPLPVASSTQQHSAEPARPHDLAPGTSHANGPTTTAPPMNVPRHMHPAPMPPSHSGEPGAPRPNAWGLPREPAPAPTATAAAPLDMYPTIREAVQHSSTASAGPSAQGPVNYSAVARGRGVPHNGPLAQPSSTSGGNQHSAEQGVPSQSAGPPPRGPSPAMGQPPTASGRPGPAPAAAGMLPSVRPIVTHAPPQSGPQLPSPSHPLAQQQALQGRGQAGDVQQQSQSSSSQPATPQQASQPSSPGSASGGPLPPSPAAAAGANDPPVRGPSLHLERHNSAPGPHPAAPVPPPPAPRPSTADKDAPSTSLPPTSGPSPASPVYSPPVSTPPVPPPYNPPTGLASSKPPSANGIPTPPPLHPPSLPEAVASAYRGAPGPSTASNNRPHLGMRPPGVPLTPPSADHKGHDDQGGAGPRLDHNNGPFPSFVPPPQPPRGGPQRLGFGAMQAKRPPSSTQSENPGLDDFQHMAIITDLLDN